MSSSGADRIGRAIASIAVVVIAVLGCRTGPEPGAYLIPLPPGITNQQTEVAILAGILNTSPPADYNPTKELSAEEFNSFIWQKFIGTARARSWFPESRSGNTIYAAVNKGDLYLRAAIERQPGTLRITIAESRGLDHADGQIHKRAITWLNNLDAHIRREVARMSVLLHST